jgi:hypothetical protein
MQLKKRNTWDIFLRKVQRPRQDQSGFLLMGAVFLVLFLSILIASSMMRADTQLTDVEIKRSQLQSFYAAETGFDRALYELRQDADWRPDASHHDVVITDGTDTFGYYTLDSAPAPDIGSWESIWLRSIGHDEFQAKPRSLRARVALADPSQFLVLTAGDLRIGSGADIDSDILGQNVYYEVNATAPDPGIDINGDVYYLNNIYNESDPNVNYCASCSSSQSPSITFAGVDINRYSDLVDNLIASTGEGVRIADGSHIDLNTYTTMSPPPELIYAEGDVYLSGTYESSTLVVAEGDIYIEGDIGSETDVSGNSLHQIGLLADQDVYIDETAPSNLSVEAFVMADGDGGADGVFQAKGEKLSKGTLDFNGAISVRGEGLSAIDTNVYNVRNYNFNSALSSNSSIPYTPYIANIVEWTETNDFAATFVAP